MLYYINIFDWLTGAHALFGDETILKHAIQKARIKQASLDEMCFFLAVKSQNKNFL